MGAHCAPLRNAYPRSVVEFILRFAQLAGHQQAAGGFHVGVAAGHKLGVIGRELAQHPVSQIIIRARLGANANADAVKILAAGGSDNAPVQCHRTTQ